MSKTRLTVEVITQEEQMFAGEADKITLPGTLGEMTVLPEHEALMSTLAAGELIVYDDTSVKRLVISPGFVQVANDTVTVLTDSAIHEEALDEQRAEEARAAAEAAMSDAYSETEIAMTVGTIERSLAEIRAIRRRKHQAH